MNVLVNIWFFLYSLVRNRFIIIAFQRSFRISHEESPIKFKRTGIEWDISASDLCWYF